MFTLVGQQARQHWLTDRLDTASTINFLTGLNRHLQTIQDPLVQRTAQALDRKIGGLRSHGPEGPPATRLNDNVNGRKWESAFAETLATNPSRGMLRSATDMRRLLSTVLARCTPEQQTAVALGTVNRIESAYPGSWLNDDMASTRLLEEATPAALRAFLNTPATDGPSCMATYLVACRLLAAMQDDAPNVATWKAASDKNYEALLDERGEEKFPEDGYQTGPNVGMLMRHQISPNFVNYDDEEDVRGVLSSVTDFDARTPQIDAALETGRPSIWGSSGTTNFILHFLADAVQDRQTADAVKRMDMNHMVLGLATMVMHDGGHSLYEVLRVLDQTADKLPDPVRQPLAPARVPASNYAAFFNRFAHDPETTQLLRTANEQAWQSTLAYRRELRA
ncbi:hypothetical protein [Pandoraea anhela]|uniref:hypothetical protein n=1 Tax=Pandoraea anhela TaxID=2508295 RepID=UPI00158330E8|nr:hypothetical protein [Pandoraea anhela]